LSIEIARQKLIHTGTMLFWLVVRTSTMFRTMQHL